MPADMWYFYTMTAEVPNPGGHRRMKRVICRMHLSIVQLLNTRQGVSAVTQLGVQGTGGYIVNPSSWSSWDDNDVMTGGNLKSKPDRESTLWIWSLQLPPAVSARLVAGPAMHPDQKSQWGWHMGSNGITTMRAMDNRCIVRRPPHRTVSNNNSNTRQRGWSNKWKEGNYSPMYRQRTEYAQ